MTDDPAQTPFDVAESAIVDALRVVRRAIADIRSGVLSAGPAALWTGPPAPGEWHAGDLAERVARQLGDLRAEETRLAGQLGDIRRQRAMLDDRAAAARVAATDARLTLDAERAANLDSEPTEDGR